MKTVSVIIPVYNVAEFLPKCLESVICQTYKDLEIICIDDESPDSSVEIIEKYAEKDDRIKLLRQKNTGLSGARNTGIRAASGDYIMVVDSDDWIDTETCACAVENIEKYNADVCFWTYVREYAGSSRVKRIFESDRFFNKEDTEKYIHRRIAGLTGEELKDPENADSIVTAWGKLYRTDIIKENDILFVDTKIIGTEDALFNLQYFGYANSSVFVNRPFNHYRKTNATSLTVNYKPRLFSQWNTLFDMMGDYIRENGCGSDFSDALDNRVALSIIGLGMNEMRNKAGRAVKMKNIADIIHSERYVQAYKKLPLKYFPLQWKIFFAFCKQGNTAGVYCLLEIMKKLVDGR